MDDGSLGGEDDVLIEDFETVRCIDITVGLLLNEHKCELVTDDMEVVKKFRVIAPTYRKPICLARRLAANQRLSDEENLGFPAVDLQTETAMCE